MKVISVIYMSRRNFWCVTRGDSWHLNFQLQKVDWEPSGRQNWGQMMEFWKILYIHFIRDPKGITYVRLILKIESDAKMAVPNGVSKTQVLSDWELHCTVSFDPTIWAEIINFALWRTKFFFWTWTLLNIFLRQRSLSDCQNSLPQSPFQLPQFYSQSDGRNEFLVD